MAPKRLLWIAPAVFVFAGACSLAVDLEGLSGRPPAPGQGGAGGGGDAGPTACQSATHPPPPASATEGGDLDFTVALRSIDLGEMTDSVAGLDLDRTCTCHFNEGASCIYPPYADKDHCDDQEGRDNSMAQVFEVVSGFAGAEVFGSTHFSARAEKGRWSLLVRIYGYNGEPDDAQVTVAIYPTTWNDATVPEPTWDGNDVWPASSESLEDGATLEKPKFTDPKGYVTNNILVASLPEVFINLSGSGGNLGIKLTAGTVMGRLEKVGERYKIAEGLVAARWTTAEIFKVAGAIKIGGMPLCNDGGSTYAAFKELICGHIDIASTLGAPSTPCDSLSFGMRFEAEPVLLGSPFPPESDPPPCPPEQDPANDACDI